MKKNSVFHNLSRPRLESFSSKSEEALWVAQNQSNWCDGDTRPIVSLRLEKDAYALHTPPLLFYGRLETISISFSKSDNKSKWSAWPWNRIICSWMPVQTFGYPCSFPVAPGPSFNLGQSAIWTPRLPGFKSVPQTSTQDWSKQRFPNAPPHADPPPLLPLTH